MNRFKDGELVWAAISYSPRYVKGKPVVCRGTRDGRFLRVEDEDSHRHSIARHHVFATRQELVKKFPDVEVDPEPDKGGAR